jgi:hypothetical protein
LGLALVVDQDTQLPLAHLLYAGARSDMSTFAAFLKPVRERLRALTSQHQQLTLVFDAGALASQSAEAGGGPGPLCNRHPPVLPAGPASRGCRSSGRGQLI